VEEVLEETTKTSTKRVNSLVILSAWVIWKHRNACVFDGTTPNLQGALQSFKDECHLWQISGAKGLAALSQGSSIVAN